MKKLLIASVAMMATFNLFAQTDEPQPQNQNVSVQSTQPDGLTLQGNTVLLTENGQTKAITESIWMRNGMQVTPEGTLIFPTGEKAKLRHGDVVSLSGAVARPIPVGTETASK